jgi:hypothetical protein
MKPPCTRNIERFKEGCPEREYNEKDGSGCPLWLELEIPTRENPRVKKKQKKCIDLWYFTLLWSQLGCLEGNQQAVETFRNAMCEATPEDPTGARPKPVRMIIEGIPNISPFGTRRLLDG